MASLAAFPQFAANPVVNRVLGVDKSLQVVRIAHLISPTEGVSTAGRTALSCPAVPYKGVTGDGRNRRSAELSRRCPGSRPLAIRGRSVLHRGSRLAGRRGRQSGEPEGRGARPGARLGASPG